jgi:pimeloyl-ACP methyl ester carboxylesterase
MRVVAPDLVPGEDDSDGDITLANATERLYEMLNANSYSPVTVIGIGFGALVAMHFAAEHGSMVRSLILVSSYVNVPDAGRRRIEATRDTLAHDGIEEFAAEYARTTITTSAAQDAQRLITSGIVETGVAGFMTELKAAMRFDGRALLNAIDAPTLVLTGDRDQRTPEADGRQVAGLLRNATFERVKDWSSRTDRST